MGETPRVAGPLPQVRRTAPEIGLNGFKHLQEPKNGGVTFCKLSAILVFLSERESARWSAIPH